MRVKSIKIVFSKDQLRWGNDIIIEDALLGVAQCFPSTHLIFELVDGIVAEIVGDGKTNWSVLEKINTRLKETEQSHRPRNYEIGFRNDQAFLRLMTRSGKRSIEIIGDKIKVDFGPKGSTVQAVKILKAIWQTMDRLNEDLYVEIEWLPEDEVELKRTQSGLLGWMDFNLSGNIEDALTATFNALHSRTHNK